ncbi:uncharacterized protein PAC_09879 [Phialocephala subalpina]|uniref:Serine-rich protein n=1 Tax=Phialocephala subalpina TaxID=576137 RepID=A0A1L7X4N3_9HELO|nr:uncharacterized protein PAC_09879 [Phialocephala subalpina]
MSDRNSPPRRPLHERSDSLTNSTRPAAAIRLVPSTPPQLLGQQRDEIYSRTPLPTHPSHFLGPPGRRKDALDDEFQGTTKDFATASPIRDSPVRTTHTTHQPPQHGNSATGSPISKPKPLPKKRLHIHKDNKTFSLLQDDSQSVQDDSKSPSSLASKHRSSDSLLSDPGNASSRSNSIGSCVPERESPGSPVVPATPASQNKQPIFADPISNSPWNYQLVGGLRKVPKTPDLKQKAATTSDSPLPPLPETSDGPPAVSHDLSTKPSFQSTETATTTSENTNYKVYGDNSASPSEVILPPPSSSDSNYQIIGSSSTASFVIHRPQTGISENENYEIHGDLSPSASYVNLSPPSRYSHESLVVPPLQPRARRSNENFGYYKSRSRESLRTGSLTSISTVLSQQEALRAIVGSGSLIQLPILKQKPEGSSSWANPLRFHPPRSHMNETPHQWSSQLSTVLSVSDGGTDRGSRSWSDGRISSGFPSSTSRHSRQMLSISSSMAQEEAASRADSIEPPTPAFIRNGQRHHSSSSIQMIADQDEYGDGITDMQDLRARPSRTRLSGFFSISDNGRTNTMRSTRSTSSSRANSLLGNSIPTWARLYYGSGERRYLGAPGSSTEGTDSRTSSFRSGSPNTDHFPLSIYSPRRRPREINPRNNNRSARGSLDITSAPQLGSDGRLIEDFHGGRFRTWSMSSIWSPHLRLDRRATRRSVWEPPSVNWSTEGGWFGRRNVQIVMFIAGFIFPFAWMIAALLPLPPSPMRDMRERDSSTSNLDSSNDVPNDYVRQFGPMDEARYESAKWWRRLNRWMSIVGLLIIIAVVVLVIVGIRQGW